MPVPNVTAAPVGIVTPFSKRYTIPEDEPGRFRPAESVTFALLKQTTPLALEAAVRRVVVTVDAVTVFPELQADDGVGPLMPMMALAH